MHTIYMSSNNILELYINLKNNCNVENVIAILKWMRWIRSNRRHSLIYSHPIMRCSQIACSSKHHTANPNKNKEFNKYTIQNGIGNCTTFVFGSGYKTVKSKKIKREKWARYGNVMSYVDQLGRQKYEDLIKKTLFLK